MYEIAFSGDRSKIIARETIGAMKKTSLRNATADITRKRKLLEKQRKEERMKSVGSVEVRRAFLAF